MKTENFTISVALNATPSDVFKAVSQVRDWWSQNIKGATDRLHEVFIYQYQDVHNCTLKITEWVPDQKINWHVLENHFNFTQDANEWKGTDIQFEIIPRGEMTLLKFTHRGLVPQYECYQVCHDAWTHYVGESLRQLIETGKGSPTPKTADKVEPQSAVIPEGPCGIHHRLLIEKPAELVYEALTTREGLAGWWTPEVIAQPETGTLSRFEFGPDYFKEMEILTLQPYSFIKWRCLKGFEEWVGTIISFELYPHAKGTLLVLHHEGWQQYSDEYTSCSYDWALFMQSLKLWCETGQGKPYPEFNQ